MSNCGRLVTCTSMRHYASLCVIIRDYASDDNQACYCTAGSTCRTYEAATSTGEIAWRKIENTSAVVICCDQSTCQCIARFWSAFARFIHSSSRSLHPCSGGGSIGTTASVHVDRLTHPDRLLRPPWWDNDHVESLHTCTPSFRAAETCHSATGPVRYGSHPEFWIPGGDCPGDQGFRNGGPHREAIWGYRSDSF